MTSSKSFATVFLWIVLITILSYLYSYPLDILSKGAFFGGSDLGLAHWIFDWQLRHLSSGNLGELFAGNMFYPLDNSVVFSINMLSTVILNVPYFWITGSPELSFNASIYFSFILCAVGMFLLARRLKLDIPSAIVASLIFSFSEFRLYLSSHITLLTMQWMPFTFLFIHKYFDEGKKASLYWAFLFFSLQIMASAHYAIFFSIIVLAFAAILCFQQNTWCLKKIMGDAAGPVVITLIVGGVCYFPYWKVTQNFGFSRSFGEQLRYGADIDTYLSAAHSYFLSPLTARFGHIEGFASPRFTALILTAAAIAFFRIQVTRFSINRKIDVALIILVLFSHFAWKTQTTWIPEFVKVFPFAKIFDRQVWQLIILTPAAWLILIRLSLTGIIRSLFSGLRKQKIFFPYFAVATLAFLISLGPAIKINRFELALNPVTTFLFFTFPGFDSIRAISRMSGLVPLGLAITSGMGLMLIGQRLGGRSKNVLYLFFIGLLLFETYPAKGISQPFTKVKPFKAEYVWLKDQTGLGPVLEWPIHVPFDGEALYVEMSIVHKKPVVNGYASYQWQGHKKLSTMKNLSRPEPLLSLYAFGVRYLLIHRVGGKFPAWAAGNIGDFKMAEKFDNTLIYENQNASTQFLPDTYWKKLDLSIERQDKSRCNLVLTFRSPETYYVSKKRKAIKIRLEGEGDLLLEEKELTLYPDLWRDGDKHRIGLNEKSCATKQIFFLIDDKKNEARFTKVDRDHLQS